MVYLREIKSRSVALPVGVPGEGLNEWSTRGRSSGPLVGGWFESLGEVKSATFRLGPPVVARGGRV